MIKRLIKVPLKIFSVWGSTQIAALILGALFFMVIGCGGSEFEGGNGDGSEFQR